MENARGEGRSGILAKGFPSPFFQGGVLPVLPGIMIPQVTIFPTLAFFVGFRRKEKGWEWWDQAGLHSEFQRRILRLVSRMGRGVGENLLSSSRNCPANKEK